MLFFKRKNIARFEKVSFEEFKRAYYELYVTKDGLVRDLTNITAIVDNQINYGSETERIKYINKIIKKAYDAIVIPEAKTIGSAGHDFTVPFNFSLSPVWKDLEYSSIVIPTGIRVSIDKGWVLELYPRSGWGTKGLHIENTVGIIDQDYYFSDNEGHILIKLTNESKKLETFDFKAGDRVCQGLFKIYGTAGKVSKTKRNGGFNSTSGDSLFSKQKL